MKIITMSLANQLKIPRSVSNKCIIDEISVNHLHIDKCFLLITGFTVKYEAQVYTTDQ
jgi:predicted metal-dependent RNase